MKHPLIKLFHARLRAVSAAERAAYPTPALWPFLQPFARHLLIFEREKNGALSIRVAGQAISELLRRRLEGEALSDLFVPEDGPRVGRMVESAIHDRVGWVFGGELRLSQFRGVAIEAMCAPEVRRPGAPSGVAICILPFSLRRHRARLRAPKIAVTSERSFDLDGFAGAPPGAPRRFAPLRRG